jgi:hypothetical protein
MTQKTTNNRESVDTGFLLQRMIFKSKQARRTGSSLWDYTVFLLAGRRWIQVDNGQEIRLPRSRKQSTIESVPDAGMA